MLVIVLLMLFVGSVTAMIVLAVMRRRGVAQPACGQCGYAVAGLQQLRCPECGADLREAGINTPAAKWTVGPVIWCLLWTLALPFPAVLASLITYGIIPKQYLSTMTVTLVPKRAGTQTSSAPYRSITFDLEGEGTRGSYAEATIRLARIDGTSSDALTVELPDLTMTGSGQAPSGAISPAIVRDWMMAEADGPDVPALEAEAAAMIRHLQSVAAGGAISSTGEFTGVTVSSRSQQVGVRRFVTTAAGIIVIVWAAGLVLIILRSRRAAGATGAARSSS
ncbi:MAG: hypothetical protein ACYTGG_11385 [Planctomycetota bacterium]